MVQKHLVMWLLSFMFVIVANLFFAQNYQDDATKEQKMISGFLGYESGTKINANAVSIYKYCCNWLAEYSAIIFVPEENRNVSDGFKSNISILHGAFWTSIYMSIVRSHIALLWLYVLCILFIGLFFQARVKRKILKYTYGYSSPDKYTWGGHMIIASFGGFFTYIFFPVPIHPLMPITLLLLAFLGLYLLVSNFQQKI